MLIWKSGLSKDVACHLGRHLETELENLHYRRRGNQRLPIEMLQAYY